MWSEEGTCDAGHRTSLLEVAEEHFLLVEHLGGLVFRFLRMDEDWTEEVARFISYPHLLNPGPKKKRENNQLYIFVKCCCAKLAVFTACFHF